MQVIGIQLDAPFTKVACLQKKRDKIKLCSLKSSLLSESEHVKQLYFPQFKGKITSGLATNDILIRSIELKTTNTRHLKEALKFHHHATTHFNLNEMISIPYLSKKMKGDIETLLFTTPKKSLKNHLLLLEKIGIKPDRVTAHSMALVRYIQWKFPLLENAFLVDLSFSEWTCVLMEKGKLKKAYSLHCGMEDLFTSLWDDRKKNIGSKEVEGIAKQIDLLQLKSQFNPNLSNKINEMKTEFTKIIYSFHRTSNQQPLIFTGHTDGLGHLPEFLTENCREVISLDKNLNPPLEEGKYAIAIGLGLEQINQSLQFLQQDFFPKKIWYRAGIYSLLLGVFSLTLSLAILFKGIESIELQKLNRVQSLEKFLDQSDPELKQSIFSKSLNKEDILKNWIAIVQKNNKEYPYIVKCPKMHEVLLWLSEHPFLKQIEKEGDSVNIQEIHYQLIQHPSIESPNEPYQAKIEMEFKTQNPITARKFHEFLLQKDEIVDTNEEIQWETLPDSYRAVFFLKNRGSYVR